MMLLLLIAATSCLPATEAGVLIHATNSEWSSKAVDPSSLTANKPFYIKNKKVPAKIWSKTPINADLPYFYPSTNYYFTGSKSTKADSLSSSKSTLSKVQMAQLAHSTIIKELKLKSPQELRIISSFTDRRNVSHFYMNRIVNGIEVSNNKAQVHILNGKVTAFSSSFKAQVNQKIKPATAKIAIKDLIKTAETELGAKHEMEVKGYYSYVENANGILVYCYNFQTRNDEVDKWYHVAIDAETGNYINLTQANLFML